MVELREPVDSLIRTPRSFTSHLRFPDPAGIRLYDDTLRDGEQMPGVAFSPAQKLALARLLSEIGIDVIDVAFPIVSEGDRAALRAILEAQGAGEIRRISTSLRCAARFRRTSTASWMLRPPPHGGRPTCRC